MSRSTEEVKDLFSQTHPKTAFETVEEGKYRLTVDGIGVLEADYLRRESGQLKCQLFVSCTLPGARTFDGVLFVGDLNLSASRSRESQARYLEDRSKAKDVDWTGIMEELAQRVLAAEREGEPATILSTVEKPDQPENVFEVDGFRFLAKHPVILFGDGGTAKSYLGLYVAGKLSQRFVSTAIFDWELTAQDHRVRLERLFGPSMPAVVYVRCSRPLVHEADRLRRIIRQHGIEYAIFDSVAFACDGPPESAEVAGRFFQSLRSLGEIGSLHIAHVSKAFEGADKKPFGSVFWHNGARSTWNVQMADNGAGDDCLSLALHNRKANLSGRWKSVGFDLTFGPDTTTVRRTDPALDPQLAQGMHLKDKMAAALKARPMTREGAR